MKKIELLKNLYRTDLNQLKDGSFSADFVDTRTNKIILRFVIPIDYTTDKSELIEQLQFAINQVKDNRDLIWKLKQKGLKK